MTMTIKMTRYLLKRSARTALPVLIVTLAAEFILFLSVFFIGRATDKTLPDMLMYRVCGIVPCLFYIVAWTVPFAIFLRQTLGSEAVFTSRLPAPPSAPLTGMITCTITWCLAAEICRGLVSAAAIPVSAAVTELTREDLFMLIFSGYGTAGYFLSGVRNMLTVTFTELYFTMILLLAHMSPRRHKLFAAVYGMTGGILIFLSFAYLTAGAESVEATAGTPGAVLIEYLPQIIALVCFSLLFRVVSGVILRQHKLVINL